MIICRKCSRRHPDGTDFCACGAFLEFDGERAPDEQPITPTASVPPPPPVEDARVAAGGASPAPSAEPAPWSGFSDGGNWADPHGAPATSDIEARPPDEPLTVRSTEPVVIQPSGRAGDISCARCGTPNAPERQFCQHCGQPLAAATAAALAVDSRARSKVPWWRRLAGRVTGRVRTTDPMQLAGQARAISRGGLSSRSVLFRSGGVMVILFALLAFLGPWRGRVINWTKDRAGASRYEVVDIEPASLSVEPTDPAVTPEPFPLQGVDKLLDRKSNTAWATQWVATDNGPEEVPADGACLASATTDSFVRITLEDPTDVKRIRLQSGRFTEDPNREGYMRPRLVELRVNGEEACEYITLDGDGELEIKDFSHDEVGQLELRVIGVYADAESDPTVEISELVLERRR